jgi:hypothetical protein
MLDSHYTLIYLPLSISHMGWLITSSRLFQPLRDRVSYPFLREGIHCSICTITQLSLALAWLVPPIGTPTPILDYILKAMLLAKLSCLCFDLGEVLGTIPLSLTQQTSDSEIEP